MTLSQVLSGVFTKGKEEATHDVTVTGSFHSPLLRLDVSDGCLYFPPTFLKQKTTISVPLTNPSRVSIRYTWKISSTSDQSPIFSVDCESGILEPNETRYVQWTFCPSSLAPVCFLVTCAYQGTHTTSTNDGDTVDPVLSIDLELFGEGVTGQLRTLSTQINLGDIVVGVASEATFEVFNAHSVMLPYQLSTSECLSFKVPLVCLFV